MPTSLIRSTSAVALAAGLGLGLAAPTSAASPVEGRGAEDLYFTSVVGRDPGPTLRGVGDGARGDVPLLCDVSSGAPGSQDDSADHPVIWRNGVWTLTDGEGSRTVSFGRSGAPHGGDYPLCGNFDGAPGDEIAVRRGNHYYVAGEAVDGGGTVREFSFGRLSDIELVGDWDGDGVDEIGLRRGARVFFASENVDGGGRVVSSSFGRYTDQAVAGDFYGQGFDSIAVLRHGGGPLAAVSSPPTVYVSGDRPGTAALHARDVLGYGRAGDVAVAGDIRGSGTDLLGVLRYRS